MMRIVIAGFGSVGRSLVSHIVERGLYEKFRIVAVLDSKGAALNFEGFRKGELRELLSTPRGGASTLEKAGRPGYTLIDVLAEVPADVLVELTPSDYETGGAGLSHIRTALHYGLHVVTANKGPLVVAGKSLLEEAETRRVKLKFRATVMGGTPLIPLISSLRHSLVELEGVLNASTNYLITRVEEGATFDEAFEEALRLGVLEADPTLDLGGIDPAAKLCILALVLGRELRLSEIERDEVGEGIEEAVATASSKRVKLRYVATLHLEDGVWGEVRLKEVKAGDLLASVKGLENGVKLRTCENEVFMKGLGGGGRATAEGVLEDLMDIYEEGFKGPNTLATRE